MTRHLMRPGDVSLLRWAQDPQLSADASEVAWCELSIDIEKDEPVTTIMVASADGNDVPRQFSEGPHDFSPRWSPDGRYLAYIGVLSDRPALHLASLAGGAPIKVKAPGNVGFIEWSPAGDRLVLVVDVNNRGEDHADGPKPREANAARVIHRLFNRLDGAGWLDGRKHLFVYDIEGRDLRQLTSGDYDHAFPSWSPDGSTVVFVSDRSRQRDAPTGAGDLWTVPASGGRARRVTTDIRDAAYPTFSPDGARVAFAGIAGSKSTAGLGSRLLVTNSDGTGAPERLAPGLDRSVAFTYGPRPFDWLSSDELVFTVADGGSVGLRRARLGERNARAVVDGDVQVSGMAAAATRRAITFASSWVDKTSEVFFLDLAKRTSAPVQISRAGAALEESVELLPAARFRATAPDGTEIEYFVLQPKGAPGRRRQTRPPLFVDIHGGPHLQHPFTEAAFVSYQTLAAAGYVVLLPNPRGSIGYGENFATQLVGGWGRVDFDDLIACADDAIERGLADPGRQFVGGYSYGGFMSAWVIGHTTRFKAACVGAPVINLVSMFGTSDANVYFAEAMKADPGTPADHLRSHSPLSYAPAVQTPVLLYVNDGDLRCPPGQADEFYVSLKWLGKEVEYVRYPGGSHLSFLPTVGAPSQCEDRAQRVLEFLGRHGGVAAPDAPGGGVTIAP